MGITTSQSYFPKDNTKDFDSDDAIVDWLTQYSDNKDATYVRQFLGRMLFPVMQVLRKFAYFRLVKKLELCFQNL